MNRSLLVHVRPFATPTGMETIQFPPKYAAGHPILALRDQTRPSVRERQKTQLSAALNVRTFGTKWTPHSATIAPPHLSVIHPFHDACAQAPSSPTPEFASFSESVPLIPPHFHTKFFFFNLHFAVSVRSGNDYMKRLRETSPALFWW